MSKDRSAFTHLSGTPSERRGRWVAGALGVLALSGLIVGAVVTPVSADDVSVGGDVGASVGIEGDCVAAGAGSTTEVSVCREDLQNLADDLPPAGPDDLEDAVPGDPAGLLPEDVGLHPEIMGRLARILPGLIGFGGAGGTDVDWPATSPPASGSAAMFDVADAADEGRMDQVLDGDTESVAPVPAGMGAVPATLPRTGGGPGIPLLRMFALAAVGRAVLRLTRRQAPDPC